MAWNDLSALDGAKLAVSWAEIAEPKASAERDQWRLQLPQLWKPWMEKLKSEMPETRYSAALHALAVLHKSSSKHFQLSAYRKDGKFLIDVFFRLPGKLEDYAKAVSEPEEYNSWLLDGINIKPDGGEYFVVFEPFRKFERPKSRELPVTWEIPYLFHWLTISKQALSVVTLVSMKKGLSWQEFIFKVAPGALLKEANASMLLLAPPTQSERLIYGAIATDLLPHQWLYTLLPLRPIGKQGEERADIMLGNFRRRAQSVQSGGPPATSPANKLLPPPKL
jgi:hypothetical protein